MLTLHFAPDSCALATLIVLEELALDYRLVAVDLRAGDQRTAEFLALNPKGRAPVLVADEGVLTETPALLDHLARSVGALMPAAPFDQARLLAFNSYLCATVHVAHAHRMRGYRWADDPAAIAAMQAKVPASVTEAFAVIEDQLSGPWVMGEVFTTADPYLFTLAQWLEADGADTARLPRVLAHRERVRARSAVRRALAVEAAYRP
ncbi:MAG: gst1 [Caulobacter sp.]|jgi:glutathione S-transferase|nr:gst1 [Caulobacter sp.]